MDEKNMDSCIDGWDEWDRWDGMDGMDGMEGWMDGWIIPLRYRFSLYISFLFFDLLFCRFLHFRQCATLALFAFKF